MDGIERPANTGQTTGDGEHKGLEQGWVVSGKAQARFIVTNGDQHIAETTAHDPAQERPCRDHQDGRQPEEKALHLRRSDHLSEQLGDVGFQAIGAVDQLLLAVEEVEEHQQRRLGENREIHPLDPVAEDEVAQNGSQQRRDQPDGDQGEQGGMERLPEGGKSIHAIEPEKFRNSVGEVGGAVELQVHRNRIAAEGKKDALAQAEQTSEAPDQIDPERHDGQGEKATEQVEPESRQHRRRCNDHRDNHHPEHNLGPAALLKDVRH